MNIYEPAGRAREYSPLALNYFKGCDNGCKYCYVKPMLKRFNANYIHDTVISDIDFSIIEKSAKKFYGCDKQILLPFTGDPFCNFETFETKEVLEILNYYEHKVAILTKNPTKALKYIDLIKSFGDRIKVGSSLTFSSVKDSLFWENGAELPSVRIDGLRLLANFGVKTWASFEPVIDPAQSIELMKSIAPFIDHVKIGKLNNYQGLDKNVDWAKFIKDSVSVMDDFNMRNQFYIKKDLLFFNKGVSLSKNEIDSEFLDL
jgi:DNA repair photolyase